MDWKEMAKVLFSGAIFFGSGMLGVAAMSVLGAKLAGAASVLPSVSSYLSLVGFATATGFAAPFAEVISEISVEWQSLDEYAESQGKKLEIYVNNLIVDAQGEAMMGMLADTLCFIIGDYVQSMINHFKTSRVITNQADDAAKAVENAVSTGQNGMTAGESGSKVDFYVTPNGDVVPFTGCRYISENAQYLDDMINSMSIPAHADGTYFSFNNYDVANPGALQVPHDASVKVSFDMLQIIDDISIPYGNWGRASYLEPITKDFPEFGLGGAT